MACTSRIAKVIVISCLLWLILFPLFGGGAWGKDMFASWASQSFLHDKKAGVPILMLTFPILISGSVASLFSVSGTSTPARYRIIRGLCDHSIRSLNRRVPEKQTILLWMIVFLPCLVYVLESIRRKLTPDMTLDKALMKSGNIFGMLAVVVLSWMLIPVSHRGPIGRLFGWDSIKVISFHIWGGRIIIAASVVHGAEHTIRYALQGKDVLKAFYLPPIGCWRNPQSYVPEICDKTESEEDCSCYDHFLPITGIAAVLGLLLIGFSSVYKIRRLNFAVFATLHYILTPLTFLAICIHYNKAILYASGSLLYYFASNFPYWVENFYKQLSCGQRSNVKVLSVEKLNSDSSKNSQQRPCIALTMEASEAAMKQFYPGAYVQLSVPSISGISHPFSANCVVGQANQIRIIFRVKGSFTQKLENALFFRTVTTMSRITGDKGADSEELRDHHLSTEYRPSIAFPRLYLDGYYGSRGLRSQIFSHDVCVLVAAGIGITPYLSLLSELVSNTNDGANSAVSDGLMVHEDRFSATQRTKQIILHWICRDRSLIDYCRKEYMDFFGNNLQKTEGGSSIHSVKIYIHNTGGDLPETQATRLPRNDLVEPTHSGGIPFELSIFRAGESVLSNIRYFFIFSALSWGGLWCLWWWFKKQGKTEYVHRIYTLVAVSLYGLIFGVLANFFGYLYLKRSRKERHISSEKFIDVELSIYKDQTHRPQGESTDDVRIGDEDQFHRSAATLEVSEGRPLVENIVEDLDVDSSSALFCCVPENLAKSLREAVNRRYSTIPIYQESFEK